MGDATDRTPKGLSIFSLLAIIVTGVIPIWGVINYGWDAVQVLALFWLESLIVGVFTWLRVRDAERNPGLEGEPFRMSGFFLIHYGLFWAVHGVLALVLILLFLPGGGPEEAWRSTAGSRDFWMAVVGVCLLQGMVHWREWARPEAWRGADPATEAFRPYGRVVALHVAVLIGFWVAALAGGVGAVVIVLCAIKLVADVVISLWQAGWKIRMEAVR